MPDLPEPPTREEIAQRLEKSLTAWTADLKPARLPTGAGNPQEKNFYQNYFQQSNP